MSTHTWKYFSTHMTSDYKRRLFGPYAAPVPPPRLWQAPWSRWRSNTAAWGQTPLCYEGLRSLSDIYSRSRPSRRPLGLFLSKSRQPLALESGGGERKKENADHLTSIAQLGVCVPFSHWYLDEAYGAVTRALLRIVYDVIEVPSLQAADEAALDGPGQFPRLFGRDQLLQP